MPTGLFQTLLGALGVLFAHFLGRSAVKLQCGQVPRGATFGWALRTTVCVYAVFYFGGLHWPFMLVLALAAASLAGGVWLESRPKKVEDLSKIMFPKE
jgi:chromate transport protein ChrA